MAFIDWNTSLEIGIQKFDQDHQKLVEIINRLDASLGAENRKQVVGEILRELLDYTLYHFRAEEAYMQSIGYSELDAHKKLHKELIDSLQERIDVFVRDRAIEISLMSFLCRWLLHHVKQEDKKYAEFAIANNKPVPFV